MITYVNEQVAGGTQLTNDQIEAYKDAYYAYDDLLAKYNEVSDWYEQHLNLEDGNPKERGELDSLRNKSRNRTLALAKACGYDTGSLSWSIDKEVKPWYYDTDVNQIRVDFG